MNWKIIIPIVVVVALALIFAAPTAHFFLVVTGSINESHAWYGFWSGFAGDLTLFTGIAIWYKKHNCHEPGGDYPQVARLLIAAGATIPAADLRAADERR